MNRFVLLAWGAIAGHVLTGCGGNSSSSVPVVTVPVVSVAPTAVNLAPGEGSNFAATITETTNTAVNWTVQEGAAGGSIDSGGHYTAPVNNGTFHVIATSQADPNQSATAVVTVAGAFMVSPSSEILGPSGIRNFTATVPVTWSVQEGAVGGAITTDGLYTAPSAAGLFHVVATSVQDPSVTTVAQVTVVSSGFFLSTGAMSAARMAHTATLLKDGRVLVTGGYGNDVCGNTACPLDSVELYDPSTGTFAATGKMSSKRARHTATLLNNGLVLVTGGGTAAAELYDPASGMFSATGSMSLSRLYDTATLLTDGKVLIAGGSTQFMSGTFATAELYDPNTGTFTATGTMTMARGGHTATLLANGKVLIAGGFSDTGELSAAELYDPARGSFTPTGSMARQREFHAAAPLGTAGVLVTGGDNGWDFADSSAEVYDVATGTFTVTGSMTHGRYGTLAAPLANGKVLVLGGDSTAELYDAGSGSFTQTGSMATERWIPAAVLLQDGRILVSGGYSGGPNADSAELYQ